MDLKTSRVGMIILTIGLSQLFGACSSEELTEEQNAQFESFMEARAKVGQAFQSDRIRETEDKEEPENALGLALSFASVGKASESSKEGLVDRIAAARKAGDCEVSPNEEDSPVIRVQGENCPIEGEYKDELIETETRITREVKISFKLKDDSFANLTDIEMIDQTILYEVYERSGGLHVDFSGDGNAISKAHGEVVMKTEGGLVVREVDSEGTPSFEGGVSHSFAFPKHGFTAVIRQLPGEGGSFRYEVNGRGISETKMKRLMNGK